MHASSLRLSSLLPAAGVLTKRTGFPQPNCGAAILPNYACVEGAALEAASGDWDFGPSVKVDGVINRLQPFIA